MFQKNIAYEINELVGEIIVTKKDCYTCKYGNSFSNIIQRRRYFLCWKNIPNALAAIAKSFPLYFIIIATGIVAASNAHK